MTGAAPDRAMRRLRSITKAADAPIGHLDIDELLGSLLHQVVDLVAADTAVVLLLDERAGHLVARAAHGLEVEVRQGVRIPVGVGFAGRIAAERRSIALEKVDDTTVANPLLWQHGLRSMLGVPLLAGERLLGVLHVGTYSGRPFTDGERDLLEAAASRVAGAVDREGREAERAAARILQRSLLPSAVPDLPGLDFAARYVPAQHGGVGGDWYDAFVLEDGTLWLTVGDVAGHGIEASVVMGRLRSTLRAYALEHSDPAEVLALADREVQRFEAGGLATVLCVVLPPTHDRLQIASAGHLPPVLATPDAPARLVRPPLGLPLGVMEDAPRASSTAELPPGAVLVTYTDGLIERRSEPLDESLRHLVRAVRPVHPETVCHEVMGCCVTDEAPRDDIALLALRRRAG